MREAIVMRLLDSLKQLLGISPGPVYDMDQAVVSVFANLPKATQQVLDHSDIELILELESRYINEAAEAEASRSGRPLEIDTDAMAVEIQSKTRSRGKELDVAHIKGVLDAELVYMRQAGLIDE
jgi:hypothetical protein